MSLKTNHKIKILENFFAQDYVFFGKPATQLFNCCPALIQEYMDIKASIGSLSIQLFGLLNPEFTYEQKMTEGLIQKRAMLLSEAVHRATKKVMYSPKTTKYLTEAIREKNSEADIIYENIDLLVERVMAEKYFQIATDNLIMGPTLGCSNQNNQFNTISGRLLGEAYRSLRNNLVEISLDLIDMTQESATT